MEFSSTCFSAKINCPDSIVETPQVMPAACPMQRKSSTKVKDTRSFPDNSREFFQDSPTSYRKGTSLTFESGALVTLLDNACIVVEGTLYCKGATRGLITFTGLSVDKYYQRTDTLNEIRWSGIFLLDSAKAELRYCSINGSRQGIEISR